MKKIAVFCGSNFGKSEIYQDAARALGRAFAAKNIALVYGGTNKGLMKIVADVLLENGGEVHGVIPRTLVDRGHQHEKLTTVAIVATRTIRKSRMAEVSDGFIAMPGGVGTLEELFEMWVDAQFDGHRKPIGLYNVDSFYRDLLRFVETMVEEGFLPPQQKDMIIVDSNPSTLLTRMRSFTPITIPKWI